MGKPIRKKWFGDPASDGFQIEVTTTDGIGGVGVTDYILEQKGTRKYITNGGGIVYLVNKLDTPLAGEAIMLCRPYGANVDKPVNKLTQHRLTTWDGMSYDWVGATSKAGEASLVSTAEGTVAPFVEPTPYVAPPVVQSTPDPEPTPEPTPEPKATPDIDNHDEWLNEDDSAPVEAVKEEVAETPAPAPKTNSRRQNKAKAKAKEQSKPIEDLLADLDDTEVEV